MKQANLVQAGRLVRQRWRANRRLKRMPDPASVRGEFYRAVTDLRDMQDYFATVGSPLDISKGVPEEIEGRCYVCDRKVAFGVNRDVVGMTGEWRETLKCPGCQLINRWRASVHLFEAIVQPLEGDRCYLTEKISPLFQALFDRHPGTEGSEYNPNQPLGAVMDLPAGPARNEDVTALTFADHRFDALLSFDVLEHVPDYRAALREFFRVLAPGGQAFISVPFTYTNETITRAIINEQGETEHLEQPVYHGDPMSADGVLCYYEFGLDLLQDLQAAGFQDAFAVCYASREWGYFDPDIMFVGRKLQ